MATAQVEAWVGAHRGSIDAAARLIDASLADAALGRMMLHRRRAVVAAVIGDFFTRIGNRFGRYLEGRVPQVPKDPVDEVATAKPPATSSAIFVTRLCRCCSSALCSQKRMARFGDAHADLKQVLAAYPGFVAAAVAAGRVALAAG